MTALDMLASLGRLRVRLFPTDAGGLRYRAPKGVLTQVLHGTIASYKAQLTHLLTTGEDLELPKGVSLPETDDSRFLTWQTGKVPASAQLMSGPLPEPKYHDEPSPSETVLGRPCQRKGCKPTTTFRSGEPASLYYKRTHICVACYGRVQAQWKLSKRQDEDTEPRLF